VIRSGDIKLAPGAHLSSISPIVAFWLFFIFPTKNKQRKKAVIKKTKALQGGQNAANRPSPLPSHKKAAFRTSRKTALLSGELFLNGR
jgi:hypothetical protein